MIRGGVGGGLSYTYRRKGVRWGTAVVTRETTAQVRREMKIVSRVGRSTLESIFLRGRDFPVRVGNIWGLFAHTPLYQNMQSIYSLHDIYLRYHARHTKASRTMHDGTSRDSKAVLKTLAAQHARQLYDSPKRESQEFTLSRMLNPHGTAFTRALSHLLRRFSGGISSFVM